MPRSLQAQASTAWCVSTDLPNGAQYAVWMLLKRLSFCLVVTFVEDTGRLTGYRYEGTDRILGVIFIQFVDFILICGLQPWHSRSMDWVNALACLLNMVAYGYISVALFIPDERSRPSYITERGMVIVSVSATALAFLYCLGDLCEATVDSIFRSFDAQKRAERGAIEIALGHQKVEEIKPKSPREEAGGGQTEHVGLTASFVQGMPRSIARYNDKTAGVADVVIVTPISEEDASSVGSSTDEEKQLKEIADESVLLRREKEVARVARARQRLNWNAAGTRGEISVSVRPDATASLGHLNLSMADGVLH
jgi:hypothetical protein